MNRFAKLAVAMLLMFAGGTTNAQEVNIGKQNIAIKDGHMTPEVLWAMGRIGSYSASPDGKHIAYQVAYYSVKANKSHHVLYMMDSDGKNQRKLTTSTKMRPMPPGFPTTA